ncbi:MAG: cadherin repeat domain-containing protein, partial [Halothece sp.]
NQPPEFAQDEFNFEVDENSAVDTVVGTVAASDPDEDELTFAIASGNDDVDDDGNPAFNINEQGEILVNDADDLDFEAQQQFALELTVADGNGGEDTATANIAVNEVQPPPDLIRTGIPERAVDESLIDLDNITSDLLPDAVQQQLQAIAQDLDTEVNTLLENNQIAQIAISPSAQQVLNSLQQAEDGITGTPPDFEIDSQVPAVI